MKKILVLFLFNVLVSTLVQAQILQDVIDVMKKCQAVMENPKGVEMTMNVKVSFMLVKVNATTVVTSMKGEKTLTKATSKMLGQTLTLIEGFDGQQEWKYNSVRGKRVDPAKRDTLYITQTTKKSDGDNDVSFDIYNDYHNAKMKVKKNMYEIEFSGPKDKEMPKKVTMYIVKDTYRFQGMECSQSGAKIKMNVTKIKYGVDDKIFQLNISDYPNAVIARVKK